MRLPDFIVSPSTFAEADQQLFLHLGLTARGF